VKVTDEPRDMVAVQTRHEGDTFSEQLMKGKITGESTIVNAAMAHEKHPVNENEVVEAMTGNDVVEVNGTVTAELQRISKLSPAMKQIMSDNIKKAEMDGMRTEINENTPADTTKDTMSDAQARRR
jgi:hypothetical protein